MIFEAGAGAFGARPSLKELKKANCVNIITALRHRRGIRWLIRFQVLCCDPGGARLGSPFASPLSSRRFMA